MSEVSLRDEDMGRRSQPAVSAVPDEVLMTFVACKDIVVVVESCNNGSFQGQLTLLEGAPAGMLGRPRSLRLEARTGIHSFTPQKPTLS